MKKLLIILIPLVLLFAASCSDDNTTQNNNKELLPTVVGYKWYYKTTDSLTQVTQHYNEITKDTTVFQNETWYKLIYDDTIFSVCKNKTGGLWFINQYGVAILYYKYPAVSSDEYDTADTTHVKVVSINESVTVPAGTYSCYHYNTYNKLNEYDEYWCPGVGLIKLVTYVLNTNKQAVIETTELVSTLFGPVK